MKTNSVDDICLAWLSGKRFVSTTPGRIHVELSSSLPVFGFALHAGSQVRDDLRTQLNLSRLQMLKEEDPRTEELIEALPNRIYPLFSRFECDLNRPRRGEPAETAVYTEPSLAWNLEVYRPPLARHEIDRSMDLHRRFYRMLQALGEDVEARFGYGVFIDMHSYNNRGRNGLPDINLGTRYQDRKRFSPVILQLIERLEQIRVQGRSLVVRENDETLRFYGGHLNRWVADRFPNILVVSLELKKFFMDEEACTYREDTFSELKNGLDAVWNDLTQSIRKQVDAHQ